MITSFLSLQNRLSNEDAPSLIVLSIFANSFFRKHTVAKHCRNRNQHPLGPDRDERERISIDLNGMGSGLSLGIAVRTQVQNKKEAN